ncbi:MAG: ATP-binding protein [Chloroflexi bacterium]|nr:ATP-binding protein [Chloroflexota bacterium]
MKNLATATSAESTPTSSSTEPQPDATCPICGGLGYVRLDAPLGHPDFGRLVPCSHRAAQLADKRLEDLRKASNLQFLSHMTFATFRQEGYGLPPRQEEILKRAYDLAKAFADNPRGWLVLSGLAGVGKTHLAAAIANQRLEQGHLVLFVSLPDLLDHLRSSFIPDSEAAYDERLEAVRTAPLLVLDDVGTQTVTPWAQEKLHQILNYRYLAQMPTVIVTQSSLEELDSRLRSWLGDPSLSQVYRLEVRDFRAAGQPSAEALNVLHLYADKTFENFEFRHGELSAEEEGNLRKAVEYARAFAAEPGGWLVFSGEYGCGKTHLAAAIANYRMQQGHPVLFIVVPDLLDHLRAAFSPQSAVPYDKLFDEVRHAPFLVLDDLGTQSSTPWAQEKLFQVFNHRYAAKLPTVITMRESLEELEEKEPRLASRMLDLSLCTPWAILAPSYRGSRRSKSKSRR